MINYSLCNLKLMPIIKIKILSTQFSIIVDGSVCDNIIFDSHEKHLPHKESNCLFLNSHFYYYDWQSIIIKIKIILKKFVFFMKNY